MQILWKTIKKMIIIVIILIIIIVININYNPKYIVQKDYNNYIKDFIYKNYSDSLVKYIDTKKCYTNGGVWFPKEISNCYISKYVVTKDNIDFYLIVTDYNSRKSTKERGIYIYSTFTSRCLERISCSDGALCGDVSIYTEIRPKFSEGCVTFIKK